LSEIGTELAYGESGAFPHQEGHQPGLDINVLKPIPMTV
jgi:hypothetical protein